MGSKEVFLKEDIVWAFETFIGQLKSSEAIHPQTIRVVERLKSQIVEIVPTHEVGSPWRTGNPTEEGWYLCWVKFEKGNENAIVYYWDNHEWSIVPRFYLASNDIILAWMPIKPYKEKEDGIQTGL